MCYFKELEDRRTLKWKATSIVVCKQACLDRELKAVFDLSYTSNNFPCVCNIQMFSASEFLSTATLICILHRI